MTDFQFDANDFGELKTLFSDVLGDSIKESRIYLLGHPGRRADPDPINAIVGRDTDVPGSVWIHPLTTRIPGQDPETSEEPPRMALNEGKGKIRDDDLLYGLPVYVRKDGRYDTIDGPAGYLAAEFLYKVKVRPQRSIDISQFDYMLLRPTNPATGSLIFTGGYPILNNDIYQLLPRLTIDLVATYGGGALGTGKAKAVQVSVDAATGTLYYTAGAAFDFNPNTGLPEHATTWTTYYPQILVEQRFLLGWVRIHKTMTTINQTDILPAQELVSKAGTGGSSGSPVTFCGLPLWYDGQQVIYEV